jgi:putative spermidine/putrescine transport system ATP-binding protein
LKQLHRQLGVTFVYVTHDQGEALTMSDRVAVFNDGEVEQIAPVEQLYEAPANRFVAGFVGDETVLTGVIGAGAGSFVSTSSAPGCEFILPGGECWQALNVNAAPPGAAVIASIRPERIAAHFTRPAASTNVLRATVVDMIYFGDHQRLRCEIAGQALATAKLPLRGGPPPQPGQDVWLHFPPGHLRVYTGVPAYETRPRSGTVAKLMF